MLSVFTHTIPGPPPGAAVFAAAAAAGPPFAEAVLGAEAGVAAGVGAGIAAEGFAAGVDAGAAAAVGAAPAVPGAFTGAVEYHVCTPLCPLHAPLLLAAIEYVPSLQIPFAPDGAPAGACAPATPHIIATRPIHTSFLILFSCRVLFSEHRPS